MTNNRLVAVPVRWRNSLPRPSSSVRVGEEFDKLRQTNMPSVAALDALPKVFHLAQDPRDVVVSSVLALLCSAPDRINEVLLLPEKCEVRQPTNSGEAYGLRWWPAKGASAMVKWVVPSMASVVVEALRKLRQETIEARRIAKWYEKNPTRLYLPKHLEHFRGQERLTTLEIAEMVFVDQSGSEASRRGAARDLCRRHGIVRESRAGCRPEFARFSDIESALLKMLPSGFPLHSVELGLKYSDSLCVIRRNELSTTKAPFRSVIEGIEQHHIHARLGGRSLNGVESVFERFGFTEPDGTPIRVNTHQFRHYLNTLAQAGGMSQLDIAKWSGRKDIQQNAAYDHVSASEMLAKIREAVGEERQMFGPLASLPKAVLISRDEFARLKVPTAHTTDFGYCVHDYAMTPCQLFQDCLNCEELVCVKGDAEKTERLKQRQVETRTLLAMAVEAVQDEYAGASRWVEHHQATLERLDQLCDILDNPNVPTGSFIHLASPNSPSRLQQATERRLALGLEAPRIITSPVETAALGAPVQSK